jgi:broad specificity phosphatase PhoE
LTAAKRILRIILIRHGQPAIALTPRTSRRGFHDYIGAYERAGLDPDSLPPEELRDLLKDLRAVFSSDRPRARESAAALAPHAEVMIDPLFAEAPLAAPPIPLLSMAVQGWAVVARLLWHAGHAPGIENYAGARRRAVQAADILIARARERLREQRPQEDAAGQVALIAHGYFNLMIGRELARRGFSRHGSHRVRYWNAVIYERAE